jgi:hypothetical protein
MNRRRSAPKSAVRILSHSRRTITEKPVQTEVRNYLAITIGPVRLAKIRICRRQVEECRKSRRVKKSIMKIILGSLLFIFLTGMHFSNQPKMSLDEYVCTIWAILKGK